MKWGARLEATQLAICRVEAIGVSIRDENSSLKLTDCIIQKFSRRYRDRGVVRGLHIHTNSTAKVQCVTVCSSSMCCGVEVSESAEATLERCTVKDVQGTCVHFASKGTGRIERSIVSGSRGRQGLCVQGVLLFCIFFSVFLSVC